MLGYTNLSLFALVVNFLSLGNTDNTFTLMLRLAIVHKHLDIFSHLNMYSRFKLGRTMTFRTWHWNNARLENVFELKLYSYITWRDGNQWKHSIGGSVLRVRIFVLATWLSLNLKLKYRRLYWQKHFETNILIDNVY